MQFGEHYSVSSTQSWDLKKSKRKIAHIRRLTIYRQIYVELYPYVAEIFWAVSHRFSWWFDTRLVFPRSLDYGRIVTRLITQPFLISYLLFFIHSMTCWYWHCMAPAAEYMRRCVATNRNLSLFSSCGSRCDDIYGIWFLGLFTGWLLARRGRQLESRTHSIHVILLLGQRMERGGGELELELSWLSIGMTLTAVVWAELTREGKSKTADCTPRGATRIIVQDSKPLRITFDSVSPSG